MKEYDIDRMDGYEFEDLINNLLKKMGFNTELMPYSQDGGIDIIAYSNEPIFKGKYIIQCKKYEGVVGEPFVRDLYGVVSSERANKGILFTNSYFSNQAITFTEGKNIELIDGKALNELLSKYYDKEISGEKIISFKDNPGFDFKKYEYLKNLINENKNDIDYYTKLTFFLHQYIIREEWDIVYSGLLDELIEMNNIILKKFAKKSKKGEVIKERITELVAFYLILRGNLSESFEKTKSIGLDHWSRFDPHYWDENTVWNYSYREYFKCDCSVIMQCYLVIFYYFNFSDGCKYIEKIYTDSYNIEYDQNKKIHVPLPKENYEHIVKNIKLLIERLDEIYSGKYKKIYVPIIEEKIEFESYRGTLYDNYRMYEYDKTINIDGFIPNWKNINIEDEKEKMKFLLTL